MGLNTRTIYHKLCAASLEAALREQNLIGLRDRLREIIPDISDQYSRTFEPKEYTSYWESNMRGLHAFQVRLMLDAIEYIKGEQKVVVDIGDSSGNHGRYLQELAPSGQVSRVISVNMDPQAVNKVQAHGGEAIQCRAEEMELSGLKVDLFMSFETLEHLTDPIRFLHKLAISNSGGFLLMTVPYRKNSRFGGNYLRVSEAGMPDKMTAEDLHFFELSREDWLLLAKFAGWEPIFNRVYWQYPRRSFLRLMAPMWRTFDFEGFLGVFLISDLTTANRYADW